MTMDNSWSFGDGSTSWNDNLAALKVATLLSFSRITMEAAVVRSFIISGIKLWLMVIIIGLSAPSLLGQAPEQDCFNAISVCSQSFSQANAFSGFGGVNEIPNGAGCLENGEVNSVWYAFTVFTAGNLTMQLNPLNLNDDYDFAIYDLTNDSCSGIEQGLNLPIRCNYSSQPGSTGLSNGAVLTAAGTSDPNQLAPMSVSVGETYVMVVSNFTSSQTGYSIDFGGSASVADQQNPRIDYNNLEGACSPDHVQVILEEQIECGSIAADGSDFVLTGPSGETVIAATPIMCNPEGYTTVVEVTFSSFLSATGMHTITAANGSDGNTILDRCGNQMDVGHSENFNVQYLGPMVTAGTVVNTDCGQETGSASVNVTGGTPPLTYSWTTGPVQTTPTATGIGQGHWVCTVVDGNGCTSELVVPVFGNDLPVISTVSETPVTCNGMNDGAAEISVQGTGPFTYEWVGYPNITGPVATGLAGGTITVIVENATGCFEVHYVTIDTPSSLSIPVSTVNPNCNQSDGEVVVQVSGGTGPYTYTWDHDSNLNSNSALGLPAGIYNVLITDVNGCYATSQAVLVDNFAPNATIGASTPDCGQNSGSAMVLPTNGTPPYSFLWNDPAAQTTQTAAGLVGGDYFVTITDGGGCVQIISVKIDTVPEPAATFATTNATCGVNDGEVDISVTGGVLPYSYIWNSHPTYSTSSANDLWADDYDIQIVDSIGCTVAVNFTIEQDPPTSTITMENGCEDHLFQFSHTTTAMPADYLWNFGDGTTSIDPSPSHYYASAGTYNVTLELLNGCAYDVAGGSLTVYPLPEPTYIVSPEIVTTRVDADFIYTGTAGSQFLWDLGNGTGSTMIHPVGEYELEGIYPISLTVTSQYGCVTTVTDDLKVELAPALFFPNAFTPNGTWANRFYRVGGVGLTSIEFIITDRWGSEVYYSSSPDQVMYEGWDGNLGGNPAPQGVYAYFVKATFFEGTEYEGSGTITLIR